LIQVIALPDQPNEISPEGHELLSAAEQRMKINRKGLPSVAVLAIAIMIAAQMIAYSQDKDLFAGLRGAWGGGGIMHLSENRKSRIVCDADYSGTASQLALSINCKSDFQDIRLRARLSRNSGRLSGTWREESYNAVGAIAGAAAANRLTFQIGGNVLGKMTVEYSARRQRVVIETLGIPLERIEIDMTRR
jgi:hypothetical protein